MSAQTSTAMRAGPATEPPCTSQRVHEWMRKSWEDGFAAGEAWGFVVGTRAGAVSWFTLGTCCGVAAAALAVWLGWAP